jgi:dynactin-6
MVGCGMSSISKMTIIADKAVVESPSIGSFNTFQARSQATSSVRISDRCTLSAGTTLDGSEGEVLEPYTVVFGLRSERVIGDKGNWEGEENLRIKHLEYLREIIPK